MAAKEDIVGIKYFHHHKKFSWTMPLQNMRAGTILCLIVQVEKQRKPLSEFNSDPKKIWSSPNSQYLRL